jgi:hypothetical protein
MELNLIKENEDGSADYAFDLTKEEQNNIIRWAIMQAIMKAAEEGIKYDPSKLDVGDTTSGGEDSVHGSGKQSSEPDQSGDGFKTSQVLG